MHRGDGWLRRVPVVLGLVALALAATFVVAACGDDDDKLPGEADPVADPTAGGGGSTTGSGDGITIYSGRSQSLVGPLIERFSKETGIAVKVRYGDTAELAATILEEGNRSPADVYFAQDAGALGALQQRNRLDRLPDALLSAVEPKYRSPDGRWAGVSGRARVAAYNTDKLRESDLPRSILDFTDPKWKGKVGWAPTNGSFQAFVTALRVQRGDDAARRWLREMKANNTKEYPNNTAALQAAASGEIEVALINHYYLYQLRQQRSNVPVRNYFFKGGDPGALVNVAGAAILTSADHKEQARRFIEYLLSPAAQKYFADETYEYPLIRQSVSIQPDLLPLAQLEPPNIDLSRLADLEGTLKMLRETGVLP